MSELLFEGFSVAEIDAGKISCEMINFDNIGIVEVRGIDYEHTIEMLDGKMMGEHRHIPRQP